MNHTDILIRNEDAKKLYFHNSTSLFRNFMFSNNHIIYRRYTLKNIKCFHTLYTLLVTTIVTKLVKFNIAKTNLHHCAQFSYSPYSDVGRVAQSV
jgi:hypothetical protein